MAWFRRSQRDFEAEIRSHIEIETDRLVAEGMSDSDARLAARREFGNVGMAQDRFHDAGPFAWASDVRTDIRFALRLVRHHPGFSANVILISALGIGACVTTFSLVSGILLTPLPFAEPERVFGLQLQTASSATAAIPVQAYRRLSQSAPVLLGIAATAPTGVVVNVDGEPTRLRAAKVTSEFFRVYGVRPILGRTFGAAEIEERAPVVLLGNTEWRTRYHGDSTVIGRRIELDGRTATVVGVMPPRFQATYSAEPALWIPYSIDYSNPDASVSPIVRLAPGVTKAQADVWLATAVRLKVASRTEKDSLVAVPLLVSSRDLLFGNVERPLLILFGSVLLVLALVAANIATMFLARSTARAGEFAVRGALGASVGRQLRQMLTESVALTALGGTIGVLLSGVAVKVIRTLGVRVLPRIDEVSLDWRVAVFAMASVVVTGMAGGIAHAMATRRGQRAGRPGASGRVTGQATSSTLVVVQIALSVVLLVGAGLLVKGFNRVAPTSPGFTLENRAVLTVSLSRDAAGRAMTEDVRRRLVNDIGARMRAVPGVRDVAVTSFMPLSGSAWTTEVEPLGTPAGTKVLRANLNIVSANYFALMQIPLVLGRPLGAPDRAGAPLAVIINETAAARWWPDVNPIGQRVAYGKGEDRKIATVAGVIRDARMYSNTTRIPAQMYLSMEQNSDPFVTFVASTTVEPRLITGDLRKALWAVAPRLPIDSSGDLETMAFEFLRTEKFFSLVMSLFASAALALSALGVYGLLSFAVVQRHREIGIRMALGASSARIGRLVLRRALVIGVIGVTVGAILARGLSRYMESVLLEVTSTDAQVFTMSAVVVFAIAALAACIPAYQAIRIDPIGSIRT